MNVQKKLFTLLAERNGDKALQLLQIASYFAPKEIEINLFSDLLGGTQSLSNTVELMIMRSLLQYEDKPNSILIIKEVREEVQKILRHEGKEEDALILAIELLDNRLASNIGSDILDHAISVFSAAKAYPELLKETSKFPNNIMMALSMLERHSDVEAFGREALKTLQGTIGEYHESTCRLQIQLGMSLLCMNRVKEGLGMLSEAYQKNTVTQGRILIDGSLKIIVDATAGSTSKPEAWVRQLVFGNVSVSETINNTDLNHWCEYAMMLRKLKWKDEALSILNQVLEKRLVLLRPDDDDIFQVMEQIAEVHMERREYFQALEVYRRVYKKRKLILGVNCIKTHHTRRGVALAFEALGMLDKALMKYEAVAEGIRSIAGGESIAYLSTRSKMAYILFRQKKYESAYAIYSHLSPNFIRLLIENDIQTVDVKYNVGHVLRQNKEDDASNVWDDTVLPEDIEVFEVMDTDTVDLIKHMSILNLYRNILGY